MTQVYLLYGCINGSWSALGHWNREEKRLISVYDTEEAAEYVISQNPLDTSEWDLFYIERREIHSHPLDTQRYDGKIVS